MMLRMATRSDQSMGNASMVWSWSALAIDLLQQRLVEELRELRVVHHELAVAEQHAAARLAERRVGRLAEQRREVLALHSGHGVGHRRRALAGHGDDGRHEVEMRGGLAGSAGRP